MIGNLILLASESNISMLIRSAMRLIKIQGKFSYEGCEPLFYEFCRVGSANNSEPLVVNYSIDDSSTAAPGEDYDVFPLSVTIPSGSDCISVPITLLMMV